MALVQPDPKAVQEIHYALQLASADSTQSQRQALQLHQTLTNQVGYAQGLAYILSTPGGAEPVIRSRAGFNLKDVITKRPDAIDNDTLVYLRTVLVRSLGDPETLVRTAAANALNTLIMVTGGPKNSADTLGELLAMIASNDQTAQEGGYKALVQITEDNTKQFEELTQLFSKLLEVCWSHMQPSAPAKIRLLGLSCIFNFTCSPSSAIYTQVQPLVKGILQLARDPTSDYQIRVLVCRTLASVAENDNQNAIPLEDLDVIVDTMLDYIANDNDEEVSQQACELFLVFIEKIELVEFLRPRLPKILPVILKAMIYADDDEVFLEEEDNTAVPDKVEDIKPTFYTGKSHAQEHDRGEGGIGQVNGNGSKKEGDEEDEDDDDEYYDDEEEDGPWNLRKYAAYALDSLAVAFEAGVLDALLPLLKDMLFSPEWLQQEAAILALGAIADGCFQPVTPHLPDLIPLLFGFLNSDKALLRSITCWTLGRYSSWCVEEGSTITVNGQSVPALTPTMEQLLRMVLDNNKRVQESGCSAFATLEENAGHHLIPYMSSILQNLVAAFAIYQYRNRLILYDAIGTFADAVSARIQTREKKIMLQIVGPALFARWEKVSDEDSELTQLLECFACFVIAVGDEFIPYAQPVIERCMSISQKSLEEYQTFVNDPANYDDIYMKNLVVALDLLSGLTQGLDEKITPFFMDKVQPGAEPPIIQLILLCSQCQVEVVQSAYALVGDLAKSCFPLLKPHLPKLMPGLIERVNPAAGIEWVSVANNAAWSSGEIALRQGPEMQPFVLPLMQRLVSALVTPNTPTTLIENSAVTIGRLALVCPNDVAPLLDHFLQRWCQALTDVRDNAEKDSAFRGLCAAARINAASVANCLYPFIAAVARIARPSAELEVMLRGDGTNIGLLPGLKQMNEASWQHAMAALEMNSPQHRQRIKDKYSV